MFYIVGAENYQLVSIEIRFVRENHALPKTYARWANKTRRANMLVYCSQCLLANDYLRGAFVYFLGENKIMLENHKLVEDLAT